MCLSLSSILSFNSSRVSRLAIMSGLLTELSHGSEQWGQEWEILMPSHCKIVGFAWKIAKKERNYKEDIGDNSRGFRRRGRERRWYKRRQREREKECLCVKMCYAEVQSGGWCILRSCSLCVCFCVCLFVFGQKLRARDDTLAEMNRHRCVW